MSAHHETSRHDCDRQDLADGQSPPEEDAREHCCVDKIHREESGEARAPEFLNADEAEDAPEDVEQRNENHEDADAAGPRHAALRCATSNRRKGPEKAV